MTQNLFGEICCRGTIFCALNERGKIAQKYWEEIPKHYPNVDIDTFIVMPNHIHGIIIINNQNIKAQDIVRAQNIVPLRNEYQKIISGSLGSIVRGYKIGVTKWSRQNTNVEIVWQRSFYDHVIRNEQSLAEIREYIVNNPAKWDDDENNLKDHSVYTPNISL
jgi:putative transposase